MNSKSNSDVNAFILKDNLESEMWLSNSTEVMVWILIGQIANVTADYSSHLLALNNFAECIE